MPDAQPQLNLVETHELKVKGLKIYDSYIVGQKATARQLFNDLPEHRKAYMALWLYRHAQGYGTSGAVWTFICSVTR